MSKLKIATVCTGIGSPEVALSELEPDHEIVFACEIDKFARQTYLANFEPKMMLTDMTKEEWVGEEYYADLFVGGIPCQAFSLAGKRLGELDPRGLLFFDFYRYVKNQQPKAFIIENVKGLLSDAQGKTFQNWLLLLGDTVNTHHQMFNHPDSLGYNLHWTVLNSKDFGVPQNRERVFIVGVRKDLPNTFRFPIGEKLTIRLKDILQPVVDEKFYLSDTALAYLTSGTENGWSDRLSMLNKEDSMVSGCITANHAKGVPYNMLEINEPILISNSDTGRKLKIETNVPPLRSHDGCGHDNVVIVKEATKQGYAVAKEGDSINLSNPLSETRRVRVGSQIANTLDTACNQAVVVPELNQVGNLYENGADAGRIYDSEGLSRILKSDGGGGGAKTGLYLVDEVRQLNESKESGGKQPYQQNRLYDINGVSTTLDQAAGRRSVNTPRIRRLTPLECFRLQGFPDSYVKPVSDSQLYKQAGNSITTKVIKGIIKNILPIITDAK